jgi:hypothetical protein
MQVWGLATRLPDGPPYLFLRPDYLPLSQDDHLDYLVLFGGTSLCLKPSLPDLSRPYYSMHDT